MAPQADRILRFLVKLALFVALCAQGWAQDKPKTPVVLENVTIERVA